MKKSTLWQKKTILPLLGICILLILMLVTFFRVKDTEFVHAQGNVVWIERKQSSQNILQDMRNDEKAIQNILKKEKCKGELYPLFDPALLLYQRNGNNRLSPYAILITSNAYLQKLGVTHPETGILYRYKDEEAGKLKLQVVHSDKRKTSELTEKDLTTYPMEGKAILADPVSFMPMDAAITKNDYMSMESFEALLQAVFQKSSATYAFSQNADYHFYLYSSTNKDAQDAEALLSKNGYTTRISDQDLAQDPFASSETIMRLCGIGLLILVPLEVFFLISAKRQQQL